MTFVGLFMGGAPNAMIAVGQAVLNLQWSAQDPKDTPSASFTVTGPGLNKTIQADTDGRAYITVPIGAYTVSVNHNGAYSNDEPQTVNAESQKSYLIAFQGVVLYDPTWKEVDAGSPKPGYNEAMLTIDVRSGVVPDAWSNVSSVMIPLHPGTIEVSIPLAGLVTWYYSTGGGSTTGNMLAKGAGYCRVVLNISEDNIITVASSKVYGATKDNTFKSDNYRASITRCLAR